MSSTLQIRTVVTKVVNPDGSITTKDERMQYRTADPVLSILGLLTFSAWSAWTDIDDTLVYLDQNGNVVS